MDERNPAAALTPVGVIVTISLALASTGVADRAGGTDLAFGRPIAWVMQDQSEADPPSRVQVGLGSPWENPTHLSTLAALADVLIFAMPAAFVLGTAALLLRRSRRVRSR